MLERFATGSQISRLTGAQAASSLPALIPTLILRLFLPFLLLLATLYLNTAGAQTPPASEPGITPASAAQLADLLENEKTRKQLIEQLRAQAPAAQQAASGQAQSSLDDSLPRRVADSTQFFLTKLLNDMGDAAAAIGAMARGEGTGGAGMADWKSALLNLALVIAATVVAFVLLRLLATRIFAMINRWAGQPAPALGRRRLAQPATLKKIAAVIGALIVDVAAIALAGVVGYGVALSVAGPDNTVGTFESLFVNAFVAVEIARALVRTVFATRFPQLRLFAMRDEVAMYWNGWLCRLVGITGYGMLVVVPVVTALFTAALGNLVGLLIMLGMYIYALRVVWNNRA
ncbi:hypothetical protein [Advenella kashmirensis]|uniref:hypothetical protein n=1 Tax=Advenella kashmirensis TaxID=310575 RepID=UPI00267D3F80|nr:hypothetical protein [Advenella kashmirensis]